MIDYQLANVEAMKIAVHLHRRLETDLTMQVDVYSAIEALDVDLAFLPLAQLSGAYLPASNETGGRPGILINSKHPRSRQRYSAGHELGHHVRDGARLGRLVDRDTEVHARSAALVKDQTEATAEAFAAWFLMPRALVAHFLRTLGIGGEPTAMQVYRLSLSLGTSYVAALEHLHTLRVVTLPVRNRLAKVTPRWIKSQLAVHGPADSWGDVWLVTEDDHPRSFLSPRSGDEIVVELKEVPSSGYVWDLVEPPNHLEMVASEFEDDAAGRAQVYGGEGRRRIVFRAARPGHERVKLAMSRPWEPNRQPVRSFALDVRVEPRIETALLPVV